MTDWGTGTGTSTSTGGTNWGGGAKTIRSPTSVGGTSSAGGGGILGEIEHAGPVGSFLSNMATGLYNTGAATVHDVLNHPYTLALGPAAPIAANALSFAEGGHGGQLTTKVAEPILHAYAQKYGAVFEHPLTGSAWGQVGHNIAKDPFGTALDALTVASLPFTAGDSAILRGGALGERLGATGADLAKLREIAALPKAERAGALAEAGRTGALSKAFVASAARRAPLTRSVELGSKEAGLPTEYTIAPAKTPLGKLAQRGYLRAVENPRLANVKGIGAAKFVARNYREQQAVIDGAHQALLGHFEKSIPFGRAEQAALHIAMQAPRSVDPSAWRQVFEDFYKQRSGDQALTAGERADAARMVKVIGGNSPRLAAKIDSVLTNPSTRFQRFYQKAAEVSQQTSKAIQSTPETIASRAARPGEALAGQLDLSKYPAAATEHPFGENQIFSHLGPTMPRSNAATLTRTTMPHGQIQAPGITRLNQSIRFTAGRYATAPTALTRAALQAFRWDAAKNYQDWLATHAVDIPESGVPAGWRRFEPTSEKIDRATQERQALMTQSLPSHEATDVLASHFDQLLPKTSETATKMVPESLARSVEQEFSRSNIFVRNFYDKPMDVWRFLVLRARPAWLVRNIVSQHFLYALGNMGPMGMARYLQGLRLERGDKAEQSFIAQALRVPAIRSKYGRILEEQGLTGVGRASTSAIYDQSAEKFATSRRGLFKEANPNQYRALQAAAAPVTAPIKAIRTFGDISAKLNQKIADDQPRIAQYLRVARDSPAADRATARMLQVAKETDKSISLVRRIVGPSTEAVLKEITPEEHVQILRQVNRVLGDWGTLSPFERKYVRRVVPFAQFFKTITQITKDLAVDHPEKLAFLNGLETAAKQNPSIFPSGQMPSWLRGAIALSGVNAQGNQTLLETNIANHFAAPEQLAAAGLTPFLGGQPSDTTGLFGPAFQAWQLYNGVNPASGSAYKGTGANLPPALRALVGTVAGFPQVSLLQQGLAGDHVPLTPWHIGAQYPSKLYANSTLDNLYNYLGLPIKRTNLAQAKKYAQEGR